MKRQIAQSKPGSPCTRVLVGYQNQMPTTQSRSAHKQRRRPHFQDYAPLHACRKSPNGQRHTQSSSASQKSETCAATHSNSQSQSFPGQSITAYNNHKCGKKGIHIPTNRRPSHAPTSSPRGIANNSSHHRKQQAESLLPTSVTTAAHARLSSSLRTRGGIIPTTLAQSFRDLSLVSH